MGTAGLLTLNGRLLSTAETPSLPSLLENHSGRHVLFFRAQITISEFGFVAAGAYTTTRTHNNAGSTVLLLERHLRRLTQSATILCHSNPQLFFRRGSSNVPPTHLLHPSVLEAHIRGVASDSLAKILPLALDERRSGEEVAVTVLLAGRLMKFGEVRVGDAAMASDLYVHVGRYVLPPSENGARLALVGRGRDVAEAKYSDWVRLRKALEKLRPPLITELLLSNDGDHILEGCVSNFFAVCRTANPVEMCHALEHRHYFEVQTAPIQDGVLPGIVRQLVIEECLDKGIPFREVAPSWSLSEEWEEAFITNSLRLVQHIEHVQAPSSWMFLESTTWNDISWKHKQFKGGPGPITNIIQKGVMERAILEGIPLTQLDSCK